MNKLFVLSLLMLNAGFVYGMQEELAVYDAIVDVEIKLPEHFKERLTKDSQTAFTVNFDARSYDVGYDILGLRLNENSAIEVRAGKGTIGAYQECIRFIAFCNRSPHPNGINIRFVNQVRKHVLLFNEMIDKYCIFNNKTIITMPKVGNVVEIFDAGFTPSDVEVAITARLVDESIAVSDSVKNPLVKYDDSVYENLKNSLEMNKEQLMLKMLLNEK